MSVRYYYAPQRSFSPYPREVLPKGFSYPAEYLDHSRDMLYPMQFGWWFIDASEEFGDFSWKMRSHRTIDWRSPTEVDPIPFARIVELAAYFDGSDHSGDPAVFVVHLPDNICVTRYVNFGAWLAAGKKEAGIGDPPYDKVASNPSYPIAAEHSDGYYFCPNCYEPNCPLKEYDEAIRCANCETFFNLKAHQAE